MCVCGISANTAGQKIYANLVLLTCVLDMSATYGETDLSDISCEINLVGVPCVRSVGIRHTHRFSKHNR